MGLGDFFRSFAEEKARPVGKTLDEVHEWASANGRDAVAAEERSGITIGL
jgi:hypothetical protein